MTDATSATGSTSSTTPTDAFAGTASDPTQSGATSSLSEDDFLDLMMDQLQNQDPLNPADPTQYMSELASFSSLDEEMQISSSTSQEASDQSASSAVDLIGKTVSYTDSSGNTDSGTVTAVDFTSSGPTLTVGQTSGITLSQLTGAAASS
jgi:flagellar basal-body rod modification protein FlgD